MTKKRESRITVQTALNRFIKKQESRKKLKPSTLASYKTIANRLRTHFGDKYLKDVTALDIEYLLNDVLIEHTHMRGLGYNTKTRKNTRSFLKLMFAHFYKKGDINQTPFAMGVSLDELDDDQFILPYENDEVRAVLALRDGSGIVEGFSVAVFEGLRPGELLGLTTRNYDQHKGTLEIEKSVCLNHIKAPKTNASKRRLKVTDATKKLLDQRLASNHFDAQEIKFHRDELTIETMTDKFFFYRLDDGTCWGDSKNFSAKLAVYFEKAGVVFRGLRPARHTFITNAVNGGLSFEEVAFHAGHSNTATLKKNYLHWTKHIIGNENLDKRNLHCTF
ncbi:site-specific integrase [Vibrio parahaemolyticus]|nr:site-specific integrase [Vibrio parahaemolyticus]